MPGQAVCMVGGHCWSSDDQWALPSSDGLTRQHLCSGGAHIPDPIVGIEQETKSELSTMKGKAKKQMKGEHNPVWGTREGFLEGSPKG